jgi:hypothetical protein
MVTKFIKSILGVGKKSVRQPAPDFDKMAKKLEKLMLEYQHCDLKVKIKPIRIKW